ncbi:ABC transporter substrate-binding protein [Streptomyces sparsogenes]|uniref:Putative secreted sugar-binding protein n=1 Tax=Streptomyces sparsogenes DSM 40356 TaxID=1331668 RepID=A0A1R1SGW6_9ACTN|nr:sugar ABC transporter substrate-binding protein [Streptomyces sparsogenes]OMI37482.1 putative secreted sugar-binding protein [Streptomyces sparsogenes DSM 40356]
MSRKGGKAVRGAAAVAVTLALALSATACGGDGSDSGSEGSGKGKIVFWDNNGGPRTAIWKQIIAKFEKKYPDIEVEYVPIPIADVQSKYDTAIQGGGDSLPDMGGVGTAYLANLVAQDALEPVADRIQDSPLKGKLVKNMVDSVRSAGGDDKEMFSVPTSANQGTLWYRTDLFQAKGLDAPTSWDNFYKAAEELTDKGGNEFGFTLRGGAGSIAQAMEMMYAQSGITTFWDGDKTTLDDPRNVAALEKYVGLYKKVTPAADLNNDFTKMVAQFDQGDIGMLQHNLGSYTDHLKAFGKDKIAGVPMPPSADGQPRTIVSNPVDGLGLFKASENKAAAWKFIEFAASAEMNSLWNQDVGAIPANVDAADDAWIKQAPPTKAALESLSDPRTKVVQLPYYLPDWNTISKADNEPDFQKVLLGKMTAKEFCDKVADELDKAQADWKKHN